MYKKLINKFYLYKIFTITLPVKNCCNPTYYIMCKYLIETTPFLNLKFLLIEILKIVNLFYNKLKKKFILFFCTEKIFLMQHNCLIKKNIAYINLNKLKNLYFYNIQKVSTFICVYRTSIDSNIIPLIKDLKLISMGFMNYQTPLNMIDYIFPIEGSYFANIYFFHFIFKKILLNVKN